MLLKSILICVVAQIALGKEGYGNLKKERHPYLQEEPGMLPTDVDYGQIFANDQLKPPQKFTDEILSIIHDENTDSHLDKTKADEIPTSMNIVKWFGDALKTNKGLKPTMSPIKESKNCSLNTTVISDAVGYLSQINDNLEEIKNVIKTNNQFLLLKMPATNAIRQKFRVRREVNKTEVENDEKTDNNTHSTRRFLRDEMVTPNNIKNKLLSYLEEAFKEIDKKVEPLNFLKNSYAAENSFKIGYIVANIDTLEVNLKKLRVEMEQNKHLWDDTRVLEVFDQLKASSNVLSSLLDSLKIYVGMENNYGF